MSDRSSESIELRAGKSASPGRDGARRADAPPAPQDGGDLRSDHAGQQTGIKALCAVARHFGLDWSLPRLLHIYGGEAEPSAAALARIALDEGMKSAVHKTRWEHLPRFKSTTPFLARLSNGAYVVVLHPPGIEAAVPSGDAREPDDLITIFNPRVPDANLFKLSRVEFEQHWTGEIVLLRRNFKLTDESQPFGLRWFIPEFWRQRSLFANVIVAALTLHVLALAVPIFFQLVIDKVLVHMGVQTLVVIGCGVVLATMFDATMNWLRGYFMLRGSSRIDIRLARTTFRHLMALPIGFFERLPAGVITKHMQQASQIREFLTGKLLMTLLDLPALFVFLPLLIYYSGELTLVVLGVSLLLALFIGLIIGPYRRRLRKLYQAEAARQSLLVESIHGMRTVKSLNLEPRRQEAWEAAAAQAIRTYVEVGKISLVANTLSQFVDRALTIAIVVTGTFLVFAGKLTVGELVAFNMLSGRVTAPILQFIGLLNNYQEVLMSVDMLGEVMNRPVEQSLARGLTPAIAGAIDLDNVVFRYPNTERPALDGFSATIPAGAFVGVVGRSGSGKTTLSALLQGLYFPTEGSVRIDGHNLRDIDLAYFRAQTGVVPQDPFLFRGTVKENIRMGLPTASFEDIVTAARAAGADDFIEALPQHYDTQLEEGGTNLSGGQKQRLSIARALLRQPRVIIFDEATSALDPESEAVVVRNLGRIAKGRTTIVISHRLQTIRDADFIIVMDMGKAVDIGTHAELLSRNLVYNQLWMQQMGRTA
ncbi:MAG TPA: peptidase domain-containing ABC transporter [Rhizomicrobium sp.]